MNVKKLITNSLLLAAGAVMHMITPPILLGMKPDFLLAMLFIIIILDDDYKSCVTAGITAGVLTAATTTFPGGQLPNLIDKIITANIIFIMIKPFRKMVNNQIKMIIIAPIGTIISGSVFLASALVLVGLPAKFETLFFTIVIPASIINTAASVVIYNTVKMAVRNKTA